MKKPSLHSLLFKAELKSLGGGKRWNTLVFLVVIDFLALFSLGAGQQILEFLEAKMDNDYVQLLIATVPSTSCRSADVKARLIDNLAFQTQFGVNDVQFMAKQYMNFRSADSTRTKLVGAFANEEHPLWTMMLSDTSNFLTSASLSSPFDVEERRTGVVLSVKAASEFGLWPLPANELPTVNWVVNDRSQTVVTLPVLGVLQYLPLDLDVALTEATMLQLVSGKATEERPKPFYFLPESKAKNASLPLPNKIKCLSGYLHTSSVMGSEKRFLEDEAQKVHLLPSKEVGGTLNAEYLLFRLNALEKARELAAELRDNKEKYGCQTKFDNGGLEIDLTDVENKENLGIFSKFARLLSFAVVVLALILIINYTGAILRMHISQNKRNLGTLMAFGYENQTITRLYLVITSVLLGAAFVISYLLVWPIGYLGLELFLLASGLDNVASEVAFSHIPIYYSVLLFVLVPLAIVSYRIRKQLTATPGDLVYDR